MEHDNDKDAFARLIDKLRRRAGWTEDEIAQKKLMDILSYKEPVYPPAIAEILAKRREK